MIYLIKFYLIFFCNKHIKHILSSKYVSRETFYFLRFQFLIQNYLVLVLWGYVLSLKIFIAAIAIYFKKYMTETLSQKIMTINLIS